MKKNTRFVTALSIIALFAVASSAQALVGVSVDTKASGEVRGYSDDREKTSVMGSIDDRQNDDKDSTEREQEDEIRINTTASLETEVDDGPVVIVRGKAVKEGAASGATDPSTVSTRGELSAFLTAVAQGDEYIREARADKNEVSVRYKEHAKLFGFIPLLVTARAVADTDGAIRVRFPWYRFLLAVNQHEIESNVEARVHAVLLGNGAQNTEAEFSTNTQARLISEIRNAFRESFQETKVDTDASATVAR